MYIPRWLLAIIISFLLFYPPYVTITALRLADKDIQQITATLSSSLQYQYWSTLNKISSVAPHLIEDQIGNFPKSYIEEEMQSAEENGQRARNMVPDISAAKKQFRFLMGLEFALSYMAIVAFFFFAFRGRPLLKFVSFMLPPVGFLLLLVPERFLPQDKSKQA